MHKTIKCFLSKMYKVYKEQVHITGYAALLGILWAIYSHVSTFIETADANTAIIAQHQTALNDLQVWKGTIDVNFARFEQKLDDVYIATVKKQPPNY